MKAAQVDAAGGEPLKTYGKAVVEILMGPLCFEHECTVSDIVDEFLLGEDLMLCDPTGPADIIQAEERMVFHGVSIPLKLIKLPTIRRATVTESVEVPPMEEVIVDAYLDREEHVNAEKERHLLVEMHPNLPKGYGCLLAPTVVDAANSTTIPVCIFNPHSNPIIIRQDSVVGQVETVKVQQTIAEHENPNEVGNDSAVRRVTLQETGGLKGRTHMSRHQAKFHRKSITRKTAIQAPTVPLPNHLKCVYEESIKGKSKVQQAQVHSLLQKYEEVFSKDKYDLGHIHLVEHTINTGDAKPIKQPPRWVPIALTGEECEALEKLQTQGVIHPLTSPWSSLIVLVQKKSSHVWPCIDYQQLNKVTKDVTYPIPRTQDCPNAMTGATMFSTMDITSAYNQVLVAEKDIPKTAFVTKYGLYDFTKMPFGLSTAPQTYEHVMELTLSGLQ